MLNRISSDLLYFDVCLSFDVDITINHVLSIFWAKLHRKMCELGKGKVAIAFPNYSQKSLGNVVRIFSSEEILTSLQSYEWKGVRDFLEFGKISEIPNNVTDYVLFSRKQSKSAFNMRKRLMNHLHMTEEEALLRIPESVDEHKKLSLPFSYIKSLSTKSTAIVFVEKEVISKADIGDELSIDELEFSTYGLSRSVAVPLF